MFNEKETIGVNFKISKDFHDELMKKAKMFGLKLNQYIIFVLTQSLSNDTLILHSRVSRETEK